MREEHLESRGFDLRHQVGWLGCGQRCLPWLHGCFQHEQSCCDLGWRKGQGLAVCWKDLIACLETQIYKRFPAKSINL